MASNIEWTDETWNPVTGCTKVSQGCKNCYAERMALRIQAMGLPRYANGFKVTLQPDLVELPAKWKKPRRIFVNSMSDLFHKEVPFDFTQDIFKTMLTYNQHEYQILTKRPEIMATFTKEYVDQHQMGEGIPRHILLGTSVENMDVVSRIEHLLETPAERRFLSCEPLLGPLDIESYLSTGGIHWVIVGGESGPKSRPIEEEWVRSLKEQCGKFNVPFFFKQWGGVNKKKTGRLLDGEEYIQFPE